MLVSTETIYQSQYVQSRGALRRELTACLRTDCALCRPGRHLRDAQEPHAGAPHIMHISLRPAEADIAPCRRLEFPRFDGHLTAGHFARFVGPVAGPPEL